MKRLLAVLAAVWLCLGFTAAAKTAPVSVDLPKDFVSATDPEEGAALAKALGLTEKQLQQQFAEKSILFAAADGKGTELRLTETEDSFSRGVGSFSDRSTEELMAFGEQLFADSEHFGTDASADGWPWLRAVFSLSDDGGAYRLQEYVTVRDGKRYTFSAFLPENSEESMVNAVFATLRLPRESAPEKVWPSLAIGAGLAVFAVLAIWMVIGLVQAAKRPDRAENKK